MTRKRKSLILKFFLLLVFSVLSSLGFARGEGAFRVSVHAENLVCESLNFPGIQPRGAIPRPSIQPEVVGEHLAREIGQDYKVGKINPLQHKLLHAGVGGFAGALFAGYDPDIAFRTATNCIENNFLNFLVPAIALGSVAWAGYEVHQAYKIDGPEAALKTLGIEVGTAVIGGAVVKGAFKIGRVGYRTSAEAIGAVLEARPGLRVALGKLTDVLSGYVVKAGSSKIGRGVGAVGAKVESVLQAVKGGITVKGLTWGRGIQHQGLPWEDYLEKILPSGSRLPKNFKTFDFHDKATGVAISAKTLNTQTAARLGNPKQVYSSLRKNIDDVVKFTEAPKLSGRTVNSAMISSREVYVAIPNKTTAAQWEQINRAIEYGKTKNIVVKITEIN